MCKGFSLETFHPFLLHALKYVNSCAEIVGNYRCYQEKLFHKWLQCMFEENKSKQQLTLKQQNTFKWICCSVGSTMNNFSIATICNENR